jgi:hypothetical protein
MLIKVLMLLIRPQKNMKKNINYLWKKLIKNSKENPQLIPIQFLNHAKITITSHKYNSKILKISILI